MKKLKELYNKYKDYAQTDVLMYLAFIIFPDHSVRFLLSNSEFFGLKT